MFQVAGGCGLGALEAAGEKKVWGIGVDADQSAIGPQILTSAVKRVESAVFLAIKAAQDGSLRAAPTTRTASPRTAWRSARSRKTFRRTSSTR